MKCPNCDIEPTQEHNEFNGHMLMCGRCRMWSNWHKTLEYAQEVWDAQVKDVLKRGGHLKWREAHP